MLATLAAFAVLGTPRLPIPPYRRLATAVVTREIDDAPYVVSGSTFFVADTISVAAYELRTLKRKWSLPLTAGNGVPNVKLAGHTLYVQADKEAKKGCRLYAVDTESGRLLWSIGGTGVSGDIAIEGNDLFVGLNWSSIADVDIRTHRIKWESHLPVDKEIGPEIGIEFGIDAITIAGSMVMENAFGFTEAFDRATGARRWQLAHTFTYGTELPAVHGVVWVPTKTGSSGVRIKNGEVVWRSAVTPAEFVGPFENKFIGLGDGAVIALDPVTGKRAWSMPLHSSKDVEFGVKASVRQNQLYVHCVDKAAVIDERGHALWEGPIQTMPGPPVFQDGGTIVCFDGARLVAYRHGGREPMPSGAGARRIAARRMIDDIDTLDDSDMETLKSLGDVAFAPALAAYIKASGPRDAYASHPGGMGAITKFFQIEKVLEAVTTRRRWRDLAAALPTLPRKSGARLLLERKIGEWGPPASVIPLFIAELKKSRGLTIDDSDNSWAESYISASSDPAAVAFMIGTLSDPGADPELREDAYVNLARTGGADGLKAVLAVRHRRTTLDPLADRVIKGLNRSYTGAASKLLKEQRDASGRDWGLLQSDALGNYQDLWLAEKVNGKWCRPVFSGVSLDQPYRWGSKPLPPEPKIDGKTGAQLLAGDWLHILVNDVAIRRDTAGSGLTDIEKHRLGLNRATKDTDGDGDPDDVDPWPNAAPRPLTESEKVLAAVFEARYHFEDSNGVALFAAPPTMRPFEMPGRTGPTIWMAEHDEKAPDTPLEQCFGNGVILISFGPTDDKPIKDGEDMIQWNSTKTEASIMISTGRTGLIHNGMVVTARKFGAEWVVVSMWTEFV